MEAEFIIRLSLLALRILLQTYGDEYSIKDPYVFFLEGERIVITGDFRGAEKIVLCDNKYLDKCSYKNEQQIILKGQTQILLEISTYPWSYGDPIWYHVVPSEKDGHRFIIGMLYDRAIPITGGYYF
jgi:hypothetical protein